MSRRSGKKQEIMDKILKIGLERFNDKGNQMSMTKLASLVGFSGVSSLYRHVESKRELWFAINIYIGQVVIDTVKEIRLDPLLDLEQQLYKILEYLIDYANNNFKDFYLMVFSFPPDYPNEDRIKGPYERSYSPDIFSMLLDVIKGMIFQKKIPKQNPFMLTSTVWSLIIGAAIAIYHAETLLDEDFIQDQAKMNNPSQEFKVEILNRITSILNYDPSKS